MADIAYNNTYQYDGELTYWGAVEGEQPSLIVEVDTVSTYFIEVEDTDLSGVLAYDNIQAYDSGFKYSGEIEFTDITDKVESVDIMRGKTNLMYDRFEAGTLRLKIADFNSDFLPTNTSSPYYPHIDTMRPIRVRSSWSGSTTNLFRGYIDTWDISWQTGQAWADVTVTATDAFKILARRATTFQGGAGDTPAVRLNGLLTDAGWSTAFRDIDTTNVTTLTQDSASTQNLLSRMQDVEFAEYGALYVDGTGRVTFKGRAAAYPSGTDYTLTDTGSGSPYTTVQATIDDETLYNFVSITAPLSTAQEASDTVSQKSFGKRELVKTDVLVNSDAQALTLAQFILAKQKDPAVRIRSVTVPTKNRLAATAVAVSAELMNTLSLTRSAPSSTLTASLLIIGINHRITQDNWVTTFITTHQ